MLAHDKGKDRLFTVNNATEPYSLQCFIYATPKEMSAINVPLKATY